MKLLHLKMVAVIGNNYALKKRASRSVAKYDKLALTGEAFKHVRLLDAHVAVDGEATDKNCMDPFQKLNSFDKLTLKEGEPLGTQFWWKVDLGSSIIFQYARVYAAKRCSNPFLLCSELFFVLYKQILFQ